MRYVHLPASAVDTALLEDATRRGNLFSSVAEKTNGTEAAATRAKAAAAV